jgi:hypothetical protein
MVKLNTELKLIALLQLAQMETNKFIATANTRPRRTAAVPMTPCSIAAMCPPKPGQAFLSAGLDRPDRKLALLFFHMSPWQGKVPPGRSDRRAQFSQG